MNRLLQILITLSLPLLFLTGAVQALLPNGTLLRFEYTRPGFPADGSLHPELFAGVRLWDTEERLEYARATQLWLVNGGSAEDLAGLRQRTGEPLYRIEEVGHMVDVERLFNATFTVLIVTALIVVLGGGWLLSGRERRPYLAEALFGTGLLVWVVAGVFALLLLGGIGSSSWDAVFVGFHQLFFPQGNWQFYYTDTLIRLFTEQLWFDFAASLVASVFLPATLCGIAGFRWRRAMK
jgi:hypothetical protein